EQVSLPPGEGGAPNKIESPGPALRNRLAVGDADQRERLTRGADSGDAAGARARVNVKGPAATPVCPVRPESGPPAHDAVPRAAPARERLGRAEVVNGQQRPVVRQEEGADGADVGSERRRPGRRQPVLLAVRARPAR